MEIKYRGPDKRPFSTKHLHLEKMVKDQTSEKVTEQMGEYWNLTQRAQQLFLRAATTSASKTTNSEVLVVDYASVLGAYAKVGMTMATRPAHLLFVQQSALAKKETGICLQNCGR